MIKFLYKMLLLLVLLLYLIFSLNCTFKEVLIKSMHFVGCYYTFLMVEAEAIVVSTMSLMLSRPSFLQLFKFLIRFFLIMNEPP